MRLRRGVTVRDGDRSPPAPPRLDFEPSYGSSIGTADQSSIHAFIPRCVHADESDDFTRQSDEEQKDAAHGSKGPESDDRIGILDAWNGVDSLIDKMSDVLAGIEVELSQQVVITGG